MVRQWLGRRRYPFLAAAALIAVGMFTTTWGSGLTKTPETQLTGKHRADNETRTISIPPELVKLLRAHIKKYGTTPDGRIFQTTLRGIIQDSAYSAVWAEARKTALTEAQFRSPLSRRPCPSVDPAASGPERTDT